MELDDKKQFIKASLPFSDLDEAGLDYALKHLEISYEKAGTRLDTESVNQHYYLLRSGSGEAKNQDGEFLDRLSSGDGFNRDQFSDASNTNNPWHRFTFLEDALVYQFPNSAIQHLAQQNPKFASYFADEQSQRLHHSLYEKGRDYRLNLPVSELMISPPLCTHTSASIVETAQTMSDARVSSILIVEDERLSGIVTDRDLRSRVLAKNRDPNEAVASVMSENLQTLSPEQSVYSAQLIMMQSNIHHLPVVEHLDDGGKHPVGIISLNDLIRAQNSEPVFMIQGINRAKNRETLYRISKQLPDLICKMIRANVRANEIGKIITSITDSMTRQLIHLAKQTFGETPCDYAWVVFGSQARQDQMLGSDQDNGLILSDKANSEDKDYFKKFAEFINEGLDKAGLKYCPGGIMAQTEKWRQPLSTWQQYFRKWIREPEPKALMHASIFYDVRHVAGSSGLTQKLIELISDEAQKNTIFQACMSENALQTSPPLGFFKTFVLEKDGNHNPVLDLKHRGTVPIVALARLYCLAHGFSEVNTEDRLKALQNAGVLSKSETSNLIDAHEFIATLRLESQNEAINEGCEVSNNLNPDDLSPLVRSQLKNAFSVVAESQRLLKMRFGHGAI